MSSLNIISLGAGVQSTAMLMMANAGELTPRPVAAIFADTGWEPQAVYDHLSYLESVSSIPIHRVSTGDIKELALANQHAGWMPVFVATEGGGMLARNCTRDMKITPIKRKTRELMKAAGAKTVTSWMGISLDEVQRMRTSNVKYISNRYPLIEKRMTRHDCLNWMERNGYPRPPRSACIGCPFHSNAHWRDMKDNRPDDWQEAVEFDRQIRYVRNPDRPVYLHRTLLPLADVDLSTPEDNGQMSFLQECEGHCGG